MTQTMNRGRVHGVCSIGNRVEVKGRRTTPNDVDDAAATIYPQLLGTSDVVDRELLSVGQSPSICQFEEAQDRLVSFLPVRNEQVRISRRSYIAMEDHAESANHNVFQACRVGVGYDANEIRTRGLVLGHCQPSRKQRAARQLAARALGLVSAAEWASMPN